MHRRDLIRWLDRITADVQRLMAYEAQFSAVQGMVRRNRNFKGKPGRFNITLFDWYAQVGAAGIRRQLKDEQDSISLMRFLRIVKSHPGLVSQKHYVSLFDKSPEWLRATAKTTFDEYSGKRGRSRAYIRRALVSGDIRALRSPSFRRIEEWVDRYVAHIDPRGMRLPAPRWRELRACLKTLDRILGRYHLLLKGHSGTLRPTILDDWTEVFAFAWAPR
jgi:hypothetical protein